ncbi:MAG: zf-HC2 domain-containing protein [Acidobacteriota bacterium]
MISCEEVVAMLAEAVDPSAPADLTARLRAHLEHCSACAAVHNTYRATIDLAGALGPPTVPEAFDIRLAERLAARRAVEEEAAAERKKEAAERKARSSEARGARRDRKRTRPAPGASPPDDTTEAAEKTAQAAPPAASGPGDPEAPGPDAPSPAGRAGKKS